MPLMEPEPPTTLPRGCGMRRPLSCGCGTVSKRQFRRAVAMAGATMAGVLTKRMALAAAGLEHADRGSPDPRPVRPASTQPAVPAPTMT